MLIQVEVYSSDWTPGNPPQQQLHASLAASTSADRLLTIGRKSGDILLAKDQSVSREHVILRVASTVDREKTVPAATAEEKAACEQDEDGLCVVLHNVGKLGTYLAADGGSVHGTAAKDGADSSETDETDDEEAIKVSQMEQNPVPVSAATRHCFHGKIVRLEEVSKAALTSLSTIGGRAVFQCGKMKSTIVLTRKAIEVLESGEGPEDFSEWKNANYYKMGLRESSKFIAGRTNIVVSQSRELNLEQVSAWSLNLPIVTHKFLYAYLDIRKSPADPLFPLNPKDFAPAADEHPFWHNTADPKLLSSCTLLSTAENDMEFLAEAAGAVVKKLYDEGSKTSSAEMIKRAQRMLDSTPHCFGLFLKRLKKIDKELQSKAELRFVKSDDFIGAIIEQVLPTDTEGKAVGRMKHTQQAVAVSGDVTTAKEAENDVTVEEDEEFQVPPVDQDDVVMEQDDSFENRSQVVSISANGENAIAGTSPSRQNETHAAPVTTKDNEQSSPALKRSKLTTVTGTGWFRAAPKDRSPYVKSREAIVAELDSPRQVAVTELCPNLILPNYERPFRNARNASGPDFRAFRKNRVLAAPLHSKIEFRSVLPRESVQFLEFDEEEAALAQQRMRADDLFRDAHQR